MKSVQQLTPREAKNRLHYMKQDLDRALERVRELERPVPMRLMCPQCGYLHLDEGEFETRPHHTYACQHCGNVWRPAIIATVGVRFLPGFKNG